MTNLEKYWIQRQDALLQLHHNASPNQREFRFKNIVDRLNRYQKCIKFHGRK